MTYGELDYGDRFTFDYEGRFTGAATMTKVRVSDGWDSYRTPEEGPADAVPAQRRMTGGERVVLVQTVANWHAETLAAGNGVPSVTRADSY